MNNRTLSIIKPDAVKAGNAGNIIAHFEKNGFKVLAMKMTRLTPATAGEFYAVHKGRGFYDELVSFMASGACIPIALEKTNAVADYRTMIGATDPAEAAAGTVRKLYAKNKGENAVHGSDSDENAAMEIAFFFSAAELVANGL